MVLSPGTHHFGPDTATLQVRTYREVQGELSMPGGARPLTAHLKMEDGEALSGTILKGPPT